MASLPLGSYGLSKVYNEYQKPRNYIREPNFFKWYGKVRQDITSAATTFTIEFREYN